MKKCLMIYSLITGHNSGLYLLISSKDNTKTMFNTWGGNWCRGVLYLMSY